MDDKEHKFTWERTDISTCICREKKYRHVHCPCTKCNGRATDRNTEMRHWKDANQCALDSSNRVNSSPNHNANHDMNVSQTNSVEPDMTESHQDVDCDNLVDMDAGNNDRSYIEDVVFEDQQTTPTSEDQHVNNHSSDEISFKKIILNAVLNALKIQRDSGVSIETFENILEYGKMLLLDSCSLDENLFDIDILTTLWPKSWSDVQVLLKEEGYSDAKEYFICFCRYETQARNSSVSKIKYTGKYSIMGSKTDLCNHCGKPGYITYYYLGLENKVKNWFRNKNLCKKMVSHWIERDHWLGRKESWPNKKEIWDGERWLQLQWFWDPNETWVIPCCCKSCGIPITSSHLINSDDGPMEGIKIVECPECLESFEHYLKTTTGSPVNIALIGHWDGWQAFNGSSSRNCGTLEVTIANLKKEDRSHIDEVYVLGFVPLTFVPKMPETYDPFLQPLMEDLCKGFIHGFDIDNLLCDIDIGIVQPNLQSVRVLLLCWSGDHPGQCEIGKLLNQGACPCRRCRLIGQHLPGGDSNNHMYYGENRLHYRHQWKPRKISEMLKDLSDVEAESRQSIRKKMSSQMGVTGISLLHKYLYPLYGFDILQDLTFDVFHTVCLNVVKSQTERLLDLKLTDKAHLSKEIKNFPWPTEFKSGRLPMPVQTYNGTLGHWKAEGLQKFSFPMADCVLNKIEDPKEQEIQHLISRLTEMHFNSGRYGWTNNMIEEHRKLSWRLNILVEEIQGLQMCTISRHNLLHIHEDIIRFSGTDNYWCAVFERAVKEYTKRSSNCKGIEKTFAFAESRREFLKPYVEKKDVLGKIDCKLGIASSVEMAKVAIDREDTSHRSLLLGAMGNICILQEDDRQKLANTLSVPFHDVAEAAYISKKCFMADRSFQGTVFRSGETAVVTINQMEVVVRLDTFLSLRAKDESYQLLVKGHIHPSCCTYDEQETQNFWSGFSSVKSIPLQEQTFCDVNAIQRKVILYECEKETSIVVDYQRHHRHLPFEVVVPVYPEKGDMLLIQGESADDIWYGHACNVDYTNKTVGVFFFVQSVRMPNIYVRETNGHYARNIVPWDSLIGIATGKWKSSSQWEKAVP